MGTILIKNGLIVTMNSERRIIEDGLVAIEDDRIIGIGKTKARAHQLNLGRGQTSR